MHWLYAAPVRVSDILDAVEFVGAAARAVIPPRAFTLVASRDDVAANRPGINAVRVRDTAPVRGVDIGNVPARVATIFCARVCVVARAESGPVRVAVVAFRDCVVAVPRAVDKDAPSRTADIAGAPTKKPRIAPKSRIFFISEINVSKICKYWAREK